MGNTLEKKHEGGWIKNHPKKLVITILLIVLPIFIITLAGINFTRRWNRVYFETTDDKNYIYNSNMSSDRKISKYIDLDVKLLEIPEEINGRYVFSISAKGAGEYSSATVTHQEVMSAKWVDVQTNPESASNNISKTINFTEEIPTKRFKIFNVERPNLYIKIVVTSKTNLPGLPEADYEEVILYYKFDVNKAIKNNNDIKVN